jgi:colanic acid biosynthesis glycosyl transferase WcaI
VQNRGVAATLTVCSEGFGAEVIAAAAAGRSDVCTLGFQPAERLSEVLSSGDIAIALLEPDASTFSVPSKVLSYFAAGRPVVALMPDNNPAAKDIGEAGGFVASPDADGIELAAGWIAARSHDRNELPALGRQARDFAERHFDIVSVADQFERILALTQAATSTKPKLRRDFSKRC